MWTRSTDGITWTKYTTLPSTAPNSRAIIYSVYQNIGRWVWLHSRSDKGGGVFNCVKLSYDNGLTWSDQSSDNNYYTYRAYLIDEQIIWLTSAASLKIDYSMDGGQTWSGNVNLSSTSLPISQAIAFGKGLLVILPSNGTDASGFDPLGTPVATLYTMKFLSGSTICEGETETATKLLTTNLNVLDQCVFEGRQESTAPHNGAVIVPRGGLGVMGNLNVGKSVFCDNITSDTLNVTGTIQHGELWNDLQLLPVVRVGGANIPTFGEMAGATGMYGWNFKVGDMIYASAQLPHGATGYIVPHVHFYSNTSATSGEISWRLTMYAFPASGGVSSLIYSNVYGQYTGDLTAYQSEIANFPYRQLNVAYLPSGLIFCKLNLYATFGSPMVTDITLLAFDIHYKFTKEGSLTENTN
jgi:hypothetical protein